jgi:23S rRNA pseudouridine2605 synthase
MVLKMSRSKRQHNSKESGDLSHIRLNKYLSTAGVCSRRKADEMIQEGKVKVNGKVVINLGVKIDPSSDQVFVNDKQVVILDEPVYIIFNKPKDCIATTRDERSRRTVMDYVQVKERVFSIGRLDRNTTGVLLLTNDGEFANHMMHPKYEIKKAYKVTLDKPLMVEHVKKIREGIRLSDGKTEPAEVSLLPSEKNNIVGIVIHEGRNRQVHRMFEAVGYVVEKLDRVAYAEISYQGLNRGEWRHLKKGEIEKLKKAAGVK